MILISNKGITLDVSRKFWIYCYFVFGFILLTIAVIAVDAGSLLHKFIDEGDVTVFNLAVTMFELALTIAGGILLLWTGCMIINLSKASESIDQPWFESEKER